MSNTDLTIRTHSDCSTGVPPTANVKSPANRIRWASVLAGLVVVVLLVVMTGCGGDADGPAPTTLAPAAPLTTIGAGVPLEPGSNLPPVEGDDETITTSTG